MQTRIVLFRAIKRFFKYAFREFLVHHHHSLEFRAKVLALMVSNDGEIDECERHILKKIAGETYKDDIERADILINTVEEYHEKIVTDNGLDFEDLVIQIVKEVKQNRHYAKKIETDRLQRFLECVDDDDEDQKIFLERILEFLEWLKHEYGESK